MKIGDLVSLKMKKTQPPQPPQHALVLNTWNIGFGMLAEIEVMWLESRAAGVSKKYRAAAFEVISESK